MQLCMEINVILCEIAQTMSQRLCALIKAKSGTTKYYCVTFKICVCVRSRYPPALI